MAETTKYGGKEYNWNQLVKKLGIDKARVEAPELDPAYQQMVKKEGQTKAAEDYAQKYVDPKTVTAPEEGGIMGGLRGYASHIPIANLFAGAMPMMPYFAAEGAAQQLEGLKRDVKGDGGKKPASAPPGPTTTTQPGINVQAEDQAIAQMYQSLLGQFQSAADTVNPYISGQAFSGEAQSAQALANRFAGGGVQGPDAGMQGALAKDFQAQAAANKAGQADVASAVKGMSGASQAALNVAPYAQLMNALASKAQYNIVYQGGQPTMGSNVPLYVQEALNQANQVGPTAAAGGASTVTAPPPAPVTQSGSNLSSSGG